MRMKIFMMQHNLLIGLENLSLQRSNTINELITVCDSFVCKLEEGRQKIVSLILPVAILVSASRKANPKEDPMKILARYRYDKNPNADKVIVLSELFDLYEYTENIKSMIVDGVVPTEQIEQYEEVLASKLLEKEAVAQQITFATMQEIDQVFSGLTQLEGGEV